MWQYQQSTGALFRDGKHVATGYSGAGEHKNVTASEGRVNEGPIPRGKWHIERGTFDSPSHGPLCLRLTPCVGTRTYGRSAFLVHGDSTKAPGTASKGCIILARAVRQQIADSGDGTLVVTE